VKLVSGLALTSCLFAGAFLPGCSSNGGSSNETSTTTTASSTNSTTTTATNTTTTTAAGGGASKKALKLAFVTNNASDFWTIARKGTEKAGQELGPNVQIQFKIPGTGTADEQKKIVDDLLVQNFDGIAISPKDAANQTDMLNNAAKKALVICQDSDAPKSNRAFYVGTDNHAAGLMAGGEIKRLLPNGGKIMCFVGSLDAQNAKDRLQGIKDAIKGTKIEIVDTRTDETDHTKAKSNVATALIKNPDVTCMVGLWSYNGPAILSAVKDANKIGKVKIVCFDEEPDTLAGIKSGGVESTVVQAPFQFGYEAIIDMAKYLNGDKSVVPPSKQKFVPTKVINKSNVDQFSAELAKLRA